MTRYTIVSVGLVLLFAIGWNALSDGLAGSSPGQSLAIDPYNDEAALSLVRTNIDRIAESEEARAQITAVAERSAKVNPLESRFLSSLAIVRAYERRTEAAIELAKAALSLDQTDRLAASIIAAHYVQMSDYKSAISVVSQALRRNPNAGSSMAELFAALTATPEGRDALRAELKLEPPWARPAINVLANQDNGYQIVYLLTSGLERRHSDELSDIDRIVAKKFIAHRQYGLGHRHFRQLLPPNESIGYIFNSDFAKQPSGLPWDWSLRSSTNATVERTGESEPRIDVNFRDKPVREVGFSQYISLPPGQLSLRIEAQANGLYAGKPLIFKIDCLEPRRFSLVSVELPTGSFDWTEFESEFGNGMAQCRFGRVYLAGQSVKGSFKTRYSGRLAVRSVKLVKIDQ
ncbi:lipopolysaccharide assembly protein LapB [Notoacmeibacter sp. MSK16QG-6]|uniref:tetratricopeptide repeat protein n=1 Tax=Notoacmeibacter sp. MSK16QG-6 TaxID=2957982 RepID=UPI00209ECE54|nr:tetratricopeptide repeat protein [Notoacmeibacter sp. MSK16QG-6]MCP1198396.1 tetratricopeptide repeat protein [Notoacmeibacter sp. MSK16QG-6]